MPVVERIPLAYNNVYLVADGDEPLLIDTGPDFRGARGIILEALGSRVPAAAVATHGHHDHAGLGRWWQGRGVPVALGPEDFRLARAPHFHLAGEFEAFTRYVAASGAPEPLQAELIAGLKHRRRLVRDAATRTGYAPPRPTERWPTALRFEPFEPDIALTPGSPLAARAHAISCPGHTPGNLVVTIESEGWLFSGDQLLPDITPTPGIQFVCNEASEWRRFASLPAFLHSLRTLRRHQFERCFPGHGEPFDNVADVIDANIAQVEQRNERVLRDLRESGPARLHQLGERLYPRALNRRWWQIVATLQGHLDVLEVEGRATNADGVWAAAP